MDLGAEALKHNPLDRVIDTVLANHGPALLEMAQTAYPGQSTVNDSDVDFIRERLDNAGLSGVAVNRRVRGTMNINMANLAEGAIYYGLSHELEPGETWASRYSSLLPGINSGLVKLFEMDQAETSVFVAFARATCPGVLKSLDDAIDTGTISEIDILKWTVDRDDDLRKHAIFYALVSDRELGRDDGSTPILTRAVQEVEELGPENYLRGFVEHAMDAEQSETHEAKLLRFLCTFAKMGNDVTPGQVAARLLEIPMENWDKSLVRALQSFAATSKEATIRALDAKIDEAGFLIPFPMDEAELRSRYTAALRDPALANIGSQQVRAAAIASIASDRRRGRRRESSSIWPNKQQPSPEVEPELLPVFNMDSIGDFYEPVAADESDGTPVISSIEEYLGKYPNTHRLRDCLYSAIKTVRQTKGEIISGIRKSDLSITLQSGTGGRTLPVWNLEPRAIRGLNNTAEPFKKARIDFVWLPEGGIGIVRAYRRGGR